MGLFDRLAGESAGEPERAWFPASLLLDVAGQVLYGKITRAAAVRDLGLTTSEVGEFDAWLAERSKFETVADFIECARGAFGLLAKHPKATIKGYGALVGYSTPDEVREKQGVPIPSR